MNQICMYLFGAISTSALVVACTSSGTAVGELHEGSAQPRTVTLTWKADAAAPERGEMSGNLPDGKHYRGRYYEVMQDVPAEVYSGAWGGAEPYWPDWPVTSTPPQREDWATFAAAYTGMAIATLASDDGSSTIRCRFTVTEPTAGLVRGGHGDCKLSSGAIIQNVVLSRD